MEPEDSEEAIALDYEAARHLLRGDYEQAETLFRQAMSLRENAFGKEHPSVASSLCNLAEIRLAQGRLAEEQALYEQALGLQEQAYPQEHPHLAYTLSKLGHIAWKGNRLEEAERMLRRALAIQRQYLGPDHHQTAVAARHLARFYRAQKRQSEADALLAESQQAIGKLMAPVFIIAAGQRAALSQAIKSTPDSEVEQLASAEPALLRSIKLTQDLVGPDNRAVADMLDHYAVLLRRLGRNQEADLQEARARAIRDKESGG